MNNLSTIIWAMIFGSIGLGFFVYGKKQKAVVPFCSGIGLIAIPFFISNVYILVFTAIVLMVLPFVLNR